MKIFDKGPFILGVLAVICWGLSFQFRSGETTFNPVLTITGLVLSGLYWFWMIYIIGSSSHLQKDQKTFWLILAISVPFFGAFIYQLLHQVKNKIVS